MRNELGKEKSLYLLQHAENPVEWQPWSPSALALAKKTNKPLFISIGYSSCHWCHVMAHESFENEAVAKIINDSFIPVKVDREEFPAVDKMYQFYLHATGKRGGWPLSIFALPDGRPFFGGTYFPPEARHGLPAFSDMLTQLGKLYSETPAEAAKYADNYDKFRKKFNAPEYTLADVGSLSKASVLDVFKKMFDTKNGGLGKDAKFPNVPVMTALLDYYDDPEVAAFLKFTADRLCTSGIFDHVNGGFYRYTVDKKWQVPHFEKMLYDNAQNASFLLAMFEKTDNMLYMKIAERTIDFILSEFSTEYGLITAMDADSPDGSGKNVEGFYYIVSDDHIKPVAENVVLHEGVINLVNTDYETYVKLEPHFEKLKEANDRVKPAKDDKVILPLNMLFCSALLHMFEMSGREFYMEQATALLGKMKHFLMDGRNLFRINYQGEVFANATLEDYVYTVKTYLDFFEVSKERPFLAEASALTEQAVKLFYDGGIFYLDADRKVADTFDDSTPNPACMMADIIEKYADLMGIPKDAAALNFAADRFMKYAGGHPTLFSAFKEYLQ